MCNLVCPRYNRETEGRGSTFLVRGFKLWNAIHSIRKTPLTPLKLLLKNTFQPSFYATCINVFSSENSDVYTFSHFLVFYIFNLLYLSQYYYQSRTSIKRPPIKGLTFIWQPAAKVPDKLSAIHCNKNLYSTATSIKRATSSCRPKRDFVFFYTSIKRPGRFEVGRFQPDKSKSMTMWKSDRFFGFC